MAFDLRQPILKCIEPVYTNLRAQKLKLLLQLLGAAEQGSLLDLGGNQGFSGEFLPLYRRFKKVVVVNVVDSKIKCEGHDGISRVIGDGCCLPFRDGAFDWVFSNAVIEHVGDWKKRQQFAGEIRRVASKGYFVTTPNKWFPIDPHTLVPLYQFVPGRLQRELIRYSPGPMTKYEEIKLLFSRTGTIPVSRKCGIEVRPAGVPEQYHFVLAGGTELAAGVSSQWPTRGTNRHTLFHGYRDWRVTRLGRTALRLRSSPISQCPHRPSTLAGILLRPSFYARLLPNEGHSNKQVVSS